MAIKKGLGSITGVSKSQKSFKSSGVSSKVHKGLKLNKKSIKIDVPLLVFTPIQLPAIKVPYSGNVISGPLADKSFLIAPSSNALIAGHQSDFNYEDNDFISYLSKPKGQMFLKGQNQRRPAQILADFDYATLNNSVNLANEADSGAARVWSRNTNARAWRDWVANSLITEIVLGPEGTNNDLRELSDDKLSSVFNTAAASPQTSGNISPYPLHQPTLEAFNSKINRWVLSNLIQGYTDLYYLEDFITLIFTLNPFAKVRGDNLNRVMDITTYMHTYFDGDALQDDSSPIVAAAKRIARRVNLKRDLKQQSNQNIPHGFTFIPKETGKYLNLRLHDPDNQQGFIKSVIETTRLISTYLKDGTFTYRDEDSRTDLHGGETPNWFDVTRYDEYQGKLKPWNTLSKNGSLFQLNHFDVNDDVYSKSLRIRKKLLKALWIKRYPNSRVFSKGPNSIAEGKTVIPDIHDNYVHDDIQKLMLRVHALDEDNLVTIAPYLISDFVGRGPKGEINHFLTMPDIFNLKKGVALQLFSSLRSDSKSSDEDLEKQKEQLRKFTFDYGPKSLAALNRSLINQFCPISESDSLSLKKALLLIDHRNIVAHLTRGIVGQTIMNAALEKSYRTATSSGYSDHFYKIKVLNQKLPSNAGSRERNALDIYGNRVEESQDALIISEASTGQTMSEDTSIYAGFLNDKRQVSDDLISLLNTTFTKATPSSLRREYIFFCILLQLSEVAGGDDINLPFFFQRSTVESQRMQGRKIPGIADALFDEYRIRLGVTSFVGEPGNNVSDFFEVAGISPGPVSFSTATLSEKTKVNKHILSRIKKVVFSTNSGGPLHGAFDDVVSLHDRISHIPGTMENALNTYSDIMYDLMNRLTRLDTRDHGLNTQQLRRQYALDAKTFLDTHASPDKQNWAYVIQDFFDGGGGYQDDRADRIGHYYTARDSQMTYFEETNAVSFATENGDVVGVRGQVAGGPAMSTGFASAEISDSDGDVSDSFKDAALEGLRHHILPFDRTKNLLIAFSENICAQLFFGFPPETSGEMFNPQFLSSFETNAHGILDSLSLMDDSGNVDMTQRELFDVVWGYCVIADQIIDQLPDVELDVEFDRATRRSTHHHAAFEPESEYTELDDVYSLARSNIWSGGLDATLRRVRRNLDSYLPPSVYEPNQNSKTASTNINRAIGLFGASTFEEAEQRKRGLVDDVFNMTTHAAAFFALAEKEVAKEPEFKLRLRKKSADPSVPLEQLAKNIRLGFLDHVSIENDFAYHAIRFMKNADPSKIRTGNADKDPNILIPNAIKDRLGLRTTKATGTISNRGGPSLGIQGDRDFNIFMLRTERQHQNTMMPYNQDSRIVYHPDYTMDDTILDERTGNRVTAFSSLPAIPNSCFGFVYNIEVTQGNFQAVDGALFNSNFQVNNDPSGLNKQATTSGVLNQFSGTPADFGAGMISEETQTDGQGFEALNEYYKKNLALTPPKIYAKMLQKNRKMQEKMQVLKNQSDRANFDQMLRQQTTSHPEFRFVKLEPPVQKTRYKLTVEFSIKKTTYQFAKAYRVNSNPPLSINNPWDGQILGPINDVQHYNYEYGGFQYVRSIFTDLASVAATFLDGSGCTTLEQRRNQSGAVLDTRRIVQDPLDTGFNSLGSDISQRMYAPIIPLGSGNPPEINKKQGLAYQFAMLAFAVDRSPLMAGDPLIVDSLGNGHQDTSSRHTSYSLDGIPADALYSEVKERCRGYVFHNNLENVLPREMIEWWDQSGGTPSSKWDEFWEWRSTSPPTLLSANKIHGRGSHHYYRTQTPQTPALAIFSSHYDGKGFRRKVGTYANPHNGDPNYSFRFEFPEFELTNKLDRVTTQTDDPKIRIELYLARNGSLWSHYSTTPIYEDETDHPTARPISDLYAGLSRDATQVVALRPTLLSSIQFKFASSDGPRFYGPYVPGEPLGLEVLTDTYNVNTSLPLIVRYDWSRHLSAALDLDLLSDDHLPYTQTVPTEEFLGMTNNDLEDYFRESARKVSEASRPFAISFFNNLRNAIESFISRKSLTADEARWLRVMIGKFPYFYDWMIQFPYLELSLKLRSEIDVIPGDTYVDFNWDLLREKSVGNISNPRSDSFSDGFLKDRTKSVHLLEKQFLTYLYAMEDHGEMLHDSFRAGMSLYEGALSKMLKTPSDEDIANDKALTGKMTKSVIQDEVSKFVESNGLSGITPDIISNLDAIYRLHMEQYSLGEGEPGDIRSKALGIELYPFSFSQVPFKISPYDIDVPSQMAEDQKSRRLKPNTREIDDWKRFEREFVYDDTNEKVFDDNKTRVCFIGIEAGELHKMIHAPATSYGVLSRDGTFRQGNLAGSNRLEDWEEGREAYKEKVLNFEIKLELFDFFRPWLKFNHKKPVIVSREKPYRVFTPGRSMPTLIETSGYDDTELRNCNLRTSSLERLLGGQAVMSLNDTANFKYRDPLPEEFIPSRSENLTVKSGYDLYDVFLKTYASRVLGLDFFEFMIPKLGSNPPIADYIPDISNAGGLLPEERNYQERINEYTMILIEKIKEASQGEDGSLGLGSIHHILKYFLDRKNLKDLVGLDVVTHSDSVGRLSLLSTGEVDFGLLASDSINLDDPDNPRMYPFRFTSPITRKSLQAAEILTAVNEYSANVMREFRDGFLFDRIVGVPYKLSDFELSQECRDNLNGEPIDAVNSMINDQTSPKIVQDGTRLLLTDGYYEELKSQLTYLARGDDELPDGTVLDNSLYPLTLRVSVCKVGSDS